MAVDVKAVAENVVRFVISHLTESLKSITKI